MTRTIRLGVVLATLALSSLTAIACGPAPATTTTPETIAAAPDISGSWTTHWGSEEVCSVDLAQNGSSVSGTYTTTGAPPGTLSGTFDGSVLTGTWADQAGGGGSMVLTFSPDGTSFSGTWGSGTSSTDGGSWTGTR